MQNKTVNSVNLFYKDQGAGPVIVFIHGLGEYASSWDAQIEFFSKSFRTITPDLRGHGQSDAGDEFITMELMANDIVALLKALDIPKAHFVGLSMGGLLC
ncbi:MAG: alpha/beta fold hydrolase, partial [Saezia sp.]